MKRLVILTWVISIPISLSAQGYFLSYVYAYNDIVIFSHQNSSDYQMEKTDGTPVWSKTLDENEYELITGLEPGVYKVSCVNEFSVVSGDPWGMGLGTWCAVDQSNRPASTKLLSVGPKYLEMAGNYAEGVIGIFAYEDGTAATLTDIDANTTIWEGDLNSGEYHLQYFVDFSPEKAFPYSVVATKSVSAVTLNGMGGMYVPSFNGTFTGREFMTYSPYCYQNGDVVKNIAVLPWEDDTRVTVVDLDDPADTIWDHLCAEAGIILGTEIALPGSADKHGRGLKVHSDKDICFMHVPYATYGSNIIGFYIKAGMNRNGSGIGTEFHLPLVCSGGSGYESRLHVIAYMDDAHVTVTRTPKYGGEEEPVWDGTLNKGENYRFTAAAWDASEVGTYHVTSTKPVGTVVNCYDDNGASFFPVIDSESIGVTEDLEPSCQMETIIKVGTVIILRYSNMSDGFHAKVFDASGRKVDEIHTPEQSGEITWGQGQGPGVYFIKVDDTRLGFTRKVVITR